MKIKEFVSICSWNILTLISWSTPKLSSYKKDNWVWCWILLYHAIQKLMALYKPPSPKPKNTKKTLSAVQVLQKFYESCIIIILYDHLFFFPRLVLSTIQVYSFSNSETEWFIVTYWYFKIVDLNLVLCASKGNNHAY